MPLVHPGAAADLARSLLPGKDDVVPVTYPPPYTYYIDTHNSAHTQNGFHEVGHFAHEVIQGCSKCRRTDGKTFLFILLDF